MTAQERAKEWVSRWDATKKAMAMCSLNLMPEDTQECYEIIRSLLAAHSVMMEALELIAQDDGFAGTSHRMRTIAREAVEKVRSIK